MSLALLNFVLDKNKDAEAHLSVFTRGISAKQKNFFV